MIQSKFKIALRCNNQVSITKYGTASKREERYEGLAFTARSQAETNRLKVRMWERQGSDTYYDPHTRTVRAVSNLSPQLDLIGGFQHKIREIGGRKKTVSRTVKRGYGDPPLVKHFTHTSGQKLRECGAAIDILCKGEPSLCRVVTLTLPANTKQAFKTLSDWSGYATNRLFQIVRRKRDKALHWFYVWEHQKRGALHLHICLFHSDGATSRAVGEEMLQSWRDILCCLTAKTGVDLLFSHGFGRQCTIREMQSINQIMRLGCGAYFSKYAAKCSSQPKQGESESLIARNARLYPPSSFWGRSRNLAQLCNTYSLSFRFDGVVEEEPDLLREEAMEVLSQSDIVLSHSFSFRKEIELAGNGTLTICEGTTEVFYVSPENYQKLLTQFGALYCNRPSSLVSQRALKRPPCIEQSF